jgi:hypothetical protein
MNSSLGNTDSHFETAELLRLQDRIVLVKSSRDHRNPQTALRGTLEVHDVPAARPLVNLVIEFPQMFTMRAHRRTIPLEEEALTRLLQSERNGTFEITLDEELEPNAPGNE